MLLRIELTNFFSIKETVCIDFRAANIKTARSKELADNVMEWNGMKVLKSVGLFGPNASGKSNIIKAIQFCCQMVLDSHLHNEGVTFNFQPFKFDGYAERPSRFLINFVHENVEYEYAFELTTSEIIRESLYHYPNGRRAKIFTRDEEAEKVYTFSEGAVVRPQDVVVNTSRKCLFLSRASSMNREFAQKLYKFFNEQFMLRVIPLNNLAAESYFNLYKDIILNALSISDTDIIDIELRKMKAPLPVAKLEGEVATIDFEEGEIIRYVTRHRRNPGVTFNLETEESDGTQKLFQILLSSLGVLRHGKSMMLDEFDLRLHVRLADFILDLTHASEDSQLLFTSHNTNLIDVRRLRKDQIVFVNKKDDASTDVYSLFDYKDFRENMDAEKAYIQGRFDAVPYVESSVSTLKALLK